MVELCKTAELNTYTWLMNILHFEEEDEKKEKEEEEEEEKQNKSLTNKNLKWYGRKDVLFNDAINKFCLRLYGVKGPLR